MKRKINGLILIPILSLALLGAKADASPVQKPWPTHAPEATPYVRIYNAEDFPKDGEDPVVYESIEDMWSHFKTQFGRFYAKSDELEMFRNLPQDEPYSFVPHSVRYELDEGDAMRMARYFDALDGVDARVIAQHTLFEGLDTWDSTLRTRPSRNWRSAHGTRSATSPCGSIPPAAGCRTG